MRREFVQRIAFLVCAGLIGLARADEIDVQASVGTVHEALFAIALDGSAGVAVGAAGDLRESTDAGASWKASATNTPMALLGVSVNAAHAIAVGQQGVVLVRDRAGAWKSADSCTDARLLGVGINAAGTAIAVGAFGSLLKSTDAGAHWEALKPNWSDFVEGGAEPHLYGVNVADDGLITVVGEFGLVLRSTDGGATWQSAHKGEASLFALDLGADGTGYAVGQDGLALATTDRGATWSPLDVGSKANLLGVAALANGTVYVTGMHEVLFSSDHGRTWQALQSKSLPRVWYAAVAAAKGATQAVAVGQAGAIVRLGK